MLVDVGGVSHGEEIPGGLCDVMATHGGRCHGNCDPEAGSSGLCKFPLDHASPVKWNGLYDNVRF